MSASLAAHTRLGVSSRHVGSAAIPPYRVRGDGFEGACRAGKSAAGRHGGTLDALTAHSPSSPHTRRL
ncbi:hypothetical protein PJP10_26775 [Mycobacterium kansasii]